MAGLFLFRLCLATDNHYVYWGNHFWAEGYCVDTVGLDAEMICKYVVYQEKKERKEAK
jgi:REP element-mobilizing transposase RayT